MKTRIIKLVQLAVISTLLGLGSLEAGLSPHQALSVAIFSASVLGTLLFWEFRLSFAFLGTSVLLLTGTIDLEHLVKFSSLEVILFLIGMMILVALLKEEGFFSWVVQLILHERNLSATKFIIVLSLLSAGLSAVTSEVVSIIFMVAAVFEICDYFKVEPTPYVIISVLATNVGSAATVLGNPIGILIASKSGLTFNDFIIKALPLSAVCLAAMLAIMIWWYRKPIWLLDLAMKAHGTSALKKLSLRPPDIKLQMSMAIFLLTIIIISLSHRLELAWRLPPNTVLFITPLFSSGLVMICKWQKARTYIEKDVEWGTLMFFLLLFAQAGTLKYTGATDVLAQKLAGLTGHSANFLIPVVLWISAIGSSILDNVVLVAAFIPVIQGLHCANLNLQPLWWALLFGGCLGGNITLIGSTANIVAIGILEKEKNIRMTFVRWFGIGLVTGLVTTGIVWLALTTLPMYR